MSTRATEQPSNARRLLVVTWYFPPDGAVGGLRWAGITKYLARLGWEVGILTAAPPVRDHTPGSVHVESCPHLWTSYRLLTQLARRLRRLVSNGSPGARPSEAAGLLHRLRVEVSGLLSFPDSTREAAGLLHRLRVEVLGLLTFPDSTRGWVLRAALRARSLIRRFQPHVVVSSGPPHFAHVAAGIAAIGSSARWFIDLRDPWVGPLAKAWESDSRARTWMAHALFPRLERFAVRAAHGVIANTFEHAKALAGRYPDMAIACVPNGVDPDCLPPPAPDPYPGLGIAYVGTLCLNRDLAPVVQALRIFLERHPEAARAGSKLRFAGEAQTPHALAFENAVAAAALEPYVEVLGYLPRAQALNVVSRSRLVVVLAQRQGLQVPAKLYESVAMGIPTLIIAEADSAAAAEGNRLGALVRDPADVDGIAAVLGQLWRDDSGRRSPCPVPITYEAIAPLVDTLLRGNGLNNGVSSLVTNVT